MTSGSAFSAVTNSFSSSMESKSKWMPGLPCSLVRDSILDMQRQEMRLRIVAAQVMRRPNRPRL